LGKLLIGLGILLVVAGSIILAMQHVTGGRCGAGMPGDIVYRKGSFTFYFPIVSSIVVSLVLSAVIYLYCWMRR